MYNDMLTQATNLSNKVISDLDKIIDKSLATDISLPSYDNIKKDKRELYIAYCNIVEFYNSINDALLSADHLHLALKEIMTKIANDKSVQYMATKEYLTKFKILSSKISSKISMVREYKTSLEFTIKLYQNMSFMFGSQF